MCNECQIKALQELCHMQAKLKGVILTIVLISIKMEDYHHGNKAPATQKSISILSFTVQAHIGSPAKKLHTKHGLLSTWGFLLPSQGNLTPLCTDGSTSPRRPQAFSQDSMLEFSPPIIGWPLYANQGWFFSWLWFYICCHDSYREHRENRKSSGLSIWSLEPRDVLECTG